MAGLFSTLLRKRREYRQNERMTRSELEQLQLKKFRLLVRHAQINSPYYARIIRERQIEPETCVPEDFPVLTKPDLIEHFDEIVTDRRINKQVISEFLKRSTDPNDLLFNQYHVTHTSGYSGQIGYFVFSESDWGRGMAQNSRQRYEGTPSIGFRRPRIAYFAAIGGHFGGVSMASMMKRGILKWFVRLALFEVNDPLPRTIAQLNEFQPDAVIGYTTALKILADKQLSGDLNISPVMVSTGGEAQSAADRELLRKAFKCNVSNIYGCTEHLIVGFSNTDDDTMIIYDDDLIYEFHDDHSVVSNLFNFTLPLIRYRMSDIFKLVEDDHSMEPYRIIHSMVGRSEIVPTFINRDGSEDFISAFTIIELFIPGVSRFQMRIIDEAHFEFAVCLESGLDDNGREAAIAATQRRLREILNQKLMDNVSFEVTVADDLPVNEKTGKYQLIVKSTESVAA